MVFKISLRGLNVFQLVRGITLTVIYLNSLAPLPPSTLAVATPVCEISSEQEQQIVDTHNRVRSSVDPSASNMRKMVRFLDYENSPYPLNMYGLSDWAIKFFMMDLLLLLFFFKLFLRCSSGTQTLLKLHWLSLVAASLDTLAPAMDVKSPQDTARTVIGTISELEKISTSFASVIATPTIRRSCQSGMRKDGTTTSQRDSVTQCAHATVMCR